MDNAQKELYLCFLRPIYSAFPAGYHRDRCLFQEAHVRLWEGEDVGVDYDTICHELEEDSLIRLPKEWKSTPFVTLTKKGLEFVVQNDKSINA